MKNTQRTFTVLAVALIFLVSGTLTAQNTIIPAPLQSYKADDRNFDVFSERVPFFVLGHQWGAADLDKLNTALRMNVTADQFGYLDPNGPIGTLTHLGEGNGDTNYLVWTSPLMYYGEEIP